MFAGLPGTGLGGIFYALLVCWMPIRELWLLARGRSSLARWAFVGGQAALVLGIVAALWAEAWAIKWLVGDATKPAGGAGEAFAAAAGSHLPPALAWTPLALLVLLVGGVHLARLLVGRQASPADRRTPPVVTGRPGEVGAAP